MEVALGCDHGGYALKGPIRQYLASNGISCCDVGADSEDSVDYPVYGMKVAKLVSSGECQRGILLCGSGIGMSIVANRLPGVRAALCHDIYTARLSRQHNDANVLVLGARIIGPGLAMEIVKTWFETEFEGGRHKRRIDLIDKLAGEEKLKA
ncbi:MAG: ribose 5-phosphate isomerase B [Desulfovibrionales bacterium]|nr:ribose 5-phosphate isomerase B [Desulfovibrionales bacterium]